MSCVWWPSPVCSKRVCAHVGYPSCACRAPTDTPRQQTEHGTGGRNYGAYITATHSESRLLPQDRKISVGDSIGLPQCQRVRGCSGLSDIEGIFARRAYFVDAQCSPLEVLLGDAEKNTTQTREPTGTRTHGQTVKGRLNDTKPARREKRAAFLVRLRRAVAWVNFTHRRALLALGGDQRKRQGGARERGAPDVLVSAGWASSLQRQSGVVGGKQRQHDDRRVGTRPALLPAPRLVKLENKS